ncbi:MAG: SDR family oxidoreductase [Pseudomonadota bacterium]|nr:SDR family oxidoreductase [Pseudomonadota bacterium]
MGQLENRVAIVTGGAQGIGASYAKILAKEGASVVIADIEDGQSIVQNIQEGGGIALNIATDVADEKSVLDTVKMTVNEFGRIDILVNNAAMFGTLEPMPFTEITVEDWDALMGVNVRGVFICVKETVPQMRKQKYGKIINIASGTLFKGTPHLLHYVTSKGAVVAMTRCLAREVGEDNICVNTLAPGLVMSENVLKRRNFDDSAIDANTATRAFKRRQLPDDLLGALVFLASAGSDFMTGQCIVVDGGSVTH